MGSIIAISQERGSGGDLIGPALAERLGYRFLDRELIHEAARVEIALLTDLRMATLALTVRVHRGHVTLKGMVDRALPQTLLRETAARVPGVEQVTLELTFMPPTRTVVL